jgi:hypothetical protein
MIAVVVPSVIAVAISAKHHCQGMSVKKHFQLHPLKETLPFWWCTVSSVSSRRNSIPLHATITEVQSNEFLFSVMIYSCRILQCIVCQQNKIAVCASLFFAAQSMLENYTNLCITNWELKLTGAARHIL